MGFLGISFQKRGKKSDQRAKDQNLGIHSACPEEGRVLRDERKEHGSHLGNNDKEVCVTLGGSLASIKHISIVSVDLYFL